MTTLLIAADQFTRSDDFWGTHREVELRQIRHAVYRWFQYTSDLLALEHMPIMIAPHDRNHVYTYELIIEQQPMLGTNSVVARETHTTTS